MRGSRHVRPAYAAFTLGALILLACGGGKRGGGETSVVGVVGPEGGTVPPLASGASVVIPAGAVAAPTTFTIEQAGTAPNGSPRFTFGPPGTTFATPVTVRLPIPPGAASPALYWSKPGSTTAWDVVGGAVVNGLLEAPVSHFSVGFVGAACSQGAGCTSANTCHTAALDCSSGVPACLDSGNRPDSTSCGAGLACAGGTCAGLYGIAGSVEGAVLSGVTVTLSPGGARTSTDSAGAYAFTALGNGSYTVTPSLAGFQFSPPSRAVVVSGASVGAQGFTSTFVVTSATMNAARSLHTATLLNSGKVLITGGTTSKPAAGFEALDSAEVYDPATGVSTTTGAMTTVRSLATATLLPSGKVLVVGGGTKPNAGGGIVPTLASAELFDPASATFAATGSMGTPRQGHTATRLANGKVLIAGGSNDACLTRNIPCQVASAELYDPLTGTFTATSNPMTRVRAGHTATLLTGEKVLIVGGAFGGPELYDPAADTFTGAGTFTEAPLYHTATLLRSGEVLVAGGQDLNLVGPGSSGVVASTFRYAPGTGTFTATGDMAHPRYFHTETLLPSGEVLIAGGLEPVSIPGQPPVVLASWELYDPVAGTFSEGRMVTPRSEHTATLLAGGQVLIAGGIASSDGGLPIASVELH